MLKFNTYYNEIYYFGIDLYSFHPVYIVANEDIPNAHIHKSLNIPLMFSGDIITIIKDVIIIIKANMKSINALKSENILHIYILIFIFINII